MSGNELAVLLTALTGTLVAIFAGLRNLRSDKTQGEITKAAQILTGYDSMTQRLEQENARLLKQLADVRAEHTETVKERDDRIDELGAQVYFLQTRPPGAPGRSSDEH